MSLRFEDPALLPAADRLAELAVILAAGINRLADADRVAHSMRIDSEPSESGLELSDPSCPDGGTVNGQRKDGPC